MWPDGPGEPDMPLSWIVWQWIINHHDHGFTADDLIQDLEAFGFPCPDDLKED